ANCDGTVAPSGQCLLCPRGLPKCLTGAPIAPIIARVIRAVGEAGRKGPMRFRRLVAAGLLALALTPPRPATALDLEQWIPGLKLSPFFTERIDYETNVFQVPSHARSSVIFRSIPGFLADYTFGSHSLSLGGRADILRYVALPNQNTVNYAG